MIIKIGDNQYMEVGSTEKLNISDIDNEIARIIEITPKEKKTDKELLDWAKENYPISQEKQMIDMHSKMTADLTEKKESLELLKIGETNG